MGNTSSKDTRRISFENNFALMPALVVQKSIEDENALAIDTFVATAEKSSELLFTDARQSVEFQEEGAEFDYWAHRIESLKKEHRLINKIIETEYEKTIENTNKLMETPQISPGRIQKMKPCYDWRAKIIKCYEDNPHQPLACSPVVEAFNQCVTSFSLED